MRWTLTIALCLLLPACFRTHYSNFRPPEPQPPGQGAPVKAESGWRHFFLFGWIPSEMPIDARAKCGAASNIHSIQTRQTFLEGLVESVAGYYVNIYAPWDGAVYCREAPVTLAPSAVPAPAAPAPAPPPAPTP